MSGSKAEPGRPAAVSAGEGLIPPAAEPVAAAATNRADGIVDLYARRALDRGCDLRRMAAEARAARFGPADRPFERPPVRRPHGAAAQPFGRGTAAHREALRAERSGGANRAPGDAAVPTRSGAGRFRRTRPSRRLVTAGLAVLLILPFATLAAGAESPGPHGGDDAPAAVVPPV